MSMGQLQISPAAGALTPLERQRLDLVAHTLAGLHENQALQFFRDRPALLAACLQQHYPLDAPLIEALGQRKDWRMLSASGVLQWSDALIDAYAQEWDWELLSKNPTLPWSGPLLERYTDRWNWQSLCTNPGLPWSQTLLEQFVYRWNWAVLSRNALLQ